MRNQAEDDSHIPLSKPSSVKPNPGGRNRGHSNLRVRWRRLRQWYSRLLYETWLFEICIIALSLGCISGVVIVLRIFDGRPQPNFPSGITLNAIISTLGTASKAALIFVVTASLSQLKWGWYQDRQKLDDIQCFDDASRGPLGSLLLLTQRPVRSLASFGALITVAALTFDPFLQQVLTFYPQTFYSPADNYESNATSAFTQQGTEFLVGALDIGFVESVNRGIWSAPSQFERNPVCATGNCTWPVFESVGWCHKCENATSRAILEDCDLNVAYDFLTANASITRWCHVSFSESEGTIGSIPLKMIDARWIQTYQEYVWPAIDDLPWTSRNRTILGLENPVAALNYVRFPGPSQAGVDFNVTSMLLQDAMECVLDFCVRTHNVSVSSGQISVTTLNTTFVQMFP